MKNRGKRYGDNVAEKILDTALKIWETAPNDVTPSKVAQKLGMNHSTIYYYFPTEFKERVAEFALMKRNVRVIGQMIATGHPLINSLAPCERAEYLEKLNNI